MILLIHKPIQKKNSDRMTITQNNSGWLAGGGAGVDFFVEFEGAEVFAAHSAVIGALGKVSLMEGAG